MPATRLNEPVRTLSATRPTTSRKSRSRQPCARSTANESSSTVAGERWTWRAKAAWRAASAAVDEPRLNWALVERGAEAVDVFSAGRAVAEVGGHPPEQAGLLVVAGRLSLGDLVHHPDARIGAGAGPRAAEQVGERAAELAARVMEQRVGHAPGRSSRLRRSYPAGAWRAALASSTTSGGAFEGEPLSNGGWGSYSMASCTLWAIAGP